MPKILMVVSSHDEMPGGARTGSWLEELAASYYVFVDAGCAVELASPRGGAAPIDPLSLGEPWLTDAGRRFQKDTTAQGKLAATRALGTVDASQFDAVYCVGGAATAWDFPQDTHLAAVVAELFARSRPVAGVCHGVLGLTAALDGAGWPIVSQRAVTGISNAEETMTGFDKVVPVLPENRLRELGGRYSCAGPLEEHVVSDAPVFTGQNPASAGPLARAVLAHLK